MNSTEWYCLKCGAKHGKCSCNNQTRNDRLFEVAMRVSPALIAFSLQTNPSNDLAICAENAMGYAHYFMTEFNRITGEK